MTDANLEFRRWNNRLNQQYSRARKRRKLEELEQQNKKLTRLLEEARKELESTHHREEALKAAFANLRAIFDAPKPIPPSTFTSEGTSPRDNGAPNSPDPSHFFSPVVDAHPDRNVNGISPVAACPSGIHPQNISEAQAPGMDLRSIFNENNSECVLNLPLEFGQGAWVDLLDGPSHTLNETDAEPSMAGHALQNSSEAPVPQQLIITASEEECFHESEHRLLPQASPLTMFSFTSKSVPLWQSLPLHVAPMTDLDKVIISVTSTGRRWAQSQGTQHSELSQYSFPSISSLLNPNHEDETINPVASAIAKHTLTTRVRIFSRKVAFHYTVAHLLKWLINPTEQNYEHLPEFLRPTSLQRTVPHPAWIDTVPWPQARNLIIQHMNFSQYDLFYQITGKSTSINWPHSDREIFQTKGRGNQLVLSPRFVAHIHNINNYTNGADLAVVFPFLAGWPISPDGSPHHWRHL